MTRRLPPIAAAAVLTAMSAIACSGSPMATAPFAPSAIPAMALAAETGDTEVGATFGALDKGKDKDKDKGKGDERKGTSPGPEDGADEDGDDTDVDDGDDNDTDDGDDDDVDDGDEADEDDDAEDGRGNPHHGAGPHSGTVSMLQGTCPAVTFNLKGLRVSTTEATEYVSEAGEAVEATCEMLRPNVQVTVTGEPGTALRTFVAATVTIVRTH